MPFIKPRWITSIEAEAEGFIKTAEWPEPMKCEHCAKVLPFKGMTHPFIKGVIAHWEREPQRCDCPQAVKHWAEADEAKAVALAEAKRQAENEKMRQKVSKIISNSGIRSRFTRRTFDTFEVDEVNRRAYQACKRYADSFTHMLPTRGANGQIEPPEKERNGIFMTGGFGTGKTHLAAAIANQLMNAGTPVICMTMIDLLARIKKTFDSGEDVSEADVMRMYEEIPLLIIDDIGSEQPTEWGISKIFAIINARYEAYMPTIITTNYTVGELVTRMTPPRSADTYNAGKTIDRFMETCVGLEMNWESRRPQ